MKVRQIGNKSVVRPAPKRAGMPWSLDEEVQLFVEVMLCVGDQAPYQQKVLRFMTAKALPSDLKRTYRRARRFAGLVEAEYLRRCQRDDPLQCTLF